LVQASEEQGAEAGGEEVARELEELGDGVDAEVMEGFVEVVGQAQGGDGEVLDCRLRIADLRFEIGDLRVGLVGEGEGPGGAGGGGDGETGVNVQGGEGGGDAAEEVVYSVENTLAAGEIEEEGVSQLVVGTSWAGLSRFVVVVFGHDEGGEAHHPSAEGFEGAAVLVGLVVGVLELGAEGDGLGEGEAGADAAGAGFVGGDDDELAVGDGFDQDEG
jgi:hypothetical protein